MGVGLRCFFQKPLHFQWVVLFWKLKTPPGAPTWFIIVFWSILCLTYNFHQTIKQRLLKRTMVSGNLLKYNMQWLNKWKAIFFVYHPKRGISKNWGPYVETESFWMQRKSDYCEVVIVHFRKTIFFSPLSHQVLISHSNKGNRLSSNPPVTRKAKARWVPCKQVQL